MIFREYGRKIPRREDFIRFAVFLNFYFFNKFIFVKVNPKCFLVLEIHKHPRSFSLVRVVVRHCQQAFLTSVAHAFCPIFSNVN